jgi:superfamily II DNA or RNA helicase
MSALVSRDSIALDLRETMIDELVVKSKVKDGKRSKYDKKIAFNTYDLIDDDELVCVPFAYYTKYLRLGFPNNAHHAPMMKCRFKLSLFERQKSIREETFAILNETRSIVLSLRCGWGKSLYGIYVACKIGYKTIVICHRIGLINQWIDSIKRACGDDTAIQLVNSSCEIDLDSDWYIINASILSKRDRMDFFHVKTALVDELHTLCTEKYSTGFHYIFPKYFIGLTATPVRSDGQDKVIELFAGTKMIYRPLEADFILYLFYSKFKPETKKNAGGDLDWTAVLKSQALSEERNIMIVDLCRYFCRRNILVLCKRKDQATWIYNTLKKYKYDCELYMGSKKTVNIEAKIIVATCSKSGVGFDAPNLDMLILASDVQEQWLQYLGRVFRREHHFPIIIDIIDDFHPLRKHAATRIDICKQAGAQVVNFSNHVKMWGKWRKIFQTMGPSRSP